MPRRDQRKTVIHSWAELPAGTSEVEEAEFWASHTPGEAPLDQMEQAPEGSLPPPMTCGGHREAAEADAGGSLRGSPADGGAVLVHAEAMRSARAATASSPGTSGAARA
jgi:hypothetical protein